MASKEKVLPVERTVDVYGTNTFAAELKIAFCHFGGVCLPAVSLAGRSSIQHADMIELSCLFLIFQSRYLRLEKRL